MVNEGCIFIRFHKNEIINQCCLPDIRLIQQNVMVAVIKWVSYQEMPIKLFSAMASPFRYSKKWVQVDWPRDWVFALSSSQMNIEW